MEIPCCCYLGWTLVALVPRLVPLWWQFRRLRLAVWIAQPLRFRVE